MGPGGLGGQEGAAGPGWGFVAPQDIPRAAVLPQPWAYQVSLPPVRCAAHPRQLAGGADLSGLPEGSSSSGPGPRRGRGLGWGGWVLEDSRRLASGSQGLPPTLAPSFLVSLVPQPWFPQCLHWEAAGHAAILAASASAHPPTPLPCLWKLKVGNRPPTPPGLRAWCPLPPPSRAKFHIRCPGPRVLTHTPPQASTGRTQSCSHVCRVHTSPPGLPPVSCHPALTPPAPLLCDSTVRSARVTGCPPVKASALAARTGQGWFLEAKISRGGAWTSSS